MNEIQFQVVVDEDGNFCASADAGDTALFTSGKTLDELREMILDMLELYEEENDCKVAGFALKFDTPERIPA